MNMLLLRFTLYAIIAYCTGFALNLAVAAPQPAAENGRHFCGGVVDWPPRLHQNLKQLNNHRYAQAPAAAALNVGEPRTVRLIYFLPNDRPHRPEVIQRMKDEILNVQTFYAEQMEAHGYGKATFRVETDPQGEPVVHRVDGVHPDSYYHANGGYWQEIGEKFDLRTNNVYCLVWDKSTDLLRGGAAGVGGGGRNGGSATMTGGFSWETMAHELGHAFGLQHDFNSGTYIMSYGPGQNWLSPCHAEYLSVHPYLNLDIPIEEGDPPTIELISPRTYPAGSQSVPVRLKVNDSEGVHQVFLFVETIEPHFAAGSPEVKGCRGLAGEKDAIVEFDYNGVIPSSRNTSLMYFLAHPMNVWAIDTNGNVRSKWFSLAEISPNYIATLEGHGDRVSSVSFSPDGTTLASGGNDGRVKLWDVATRAHIANFKGHGDRVSSVSFSPEGTTGTILASGGGDTVKLWDTSELTLPRPEEVAEFDIPDSNLRAAIATRLGVPPGAPIFRGNIKLLTALFAADASISNLTGLESATHLTHLNLRNNSVSDLSPLVANTGLGDGNTVDIRENPLSYLSIHTHIPALQSRGVTVEFDNQAHPALLKISGNHQKGTAFTPLSNPYVVEVQDERGAAFKGVAVTFTITAGDGVLGTISTKTDENGRAESTLRLGPNLGTNTVTVSADGIENPVIFYALSDNLPTEYLLSVPAGVSLIHVPLKVRTVNGVAQTLTSVTDLYDALGGTDTVNLLITRDSTTQRWHSYLGESSRGTIVDKALTDDTGIVAFMNHAVSLRLRGDARGTNGNSVITLHPGLNLVGVPLRDSRIARVSDLFALEGIGDNISTITVLDNGVLKVISRTSIGNQVGTTGDTLIDGGQSFILTARETTTVAISGDAWYNTSEKATVPPPPIPGIEVGDATPVLVLSGSIVGEGIHVNGEGFDVIVKNLSTGRAVTTVVANENLSPLDNLDPNLIRGVGYQVTVVDVEAGQLARIGDILEISAQFPDTSVRVQPLQYTVTAEDILQSRVELGALEIYAILWETELLQNYPNPFTPET